MDGEDERPQLAFDVRDDPAKLTVEVANYPKLEKAPSLDKEKKSRKK